MARNDKLLLCTYLLLSYTIYTEKRRRSNTMSLPGPFELVIILLVALVVFGAAKLPEIGRSIGKSIQEFKKGLNEESKK